MSPIKLLIVDDEVNIAKTIAATFSTAEYRTTICNDGTEAWQRLQSASWDIVFLDIRLPGLDGMEILRRIYDNNLAVNVVMITAYGTIDNAVLAMKYGAVDFIQKPLEPSVLRTAVQKILDRQKLNELTADEYSEFIELAKLRIHERDYHLAHAAIKKAITCKPESAEAYNLLGGICEVLGDNVTAVQAYQMAIRFDPNYKPASENLQRIGSLEANSTGILDILAALKNRTET